MRRRKNNNTISFFAFQDIIISVVGIFIVVVVIMVLDLAQRVESRAEEPSGVRATQVLDDIKTQQETLERVDRQLVSAAERRLEFAGINAFNLEYETEAVRKTVDGLSLEISELATALNEARDGTELAEQEILAEQAELADLRQQAEAEEALRSQISDYQSRLREPRQTTDRLFRDRLADGRWLTVVEIDPNRIVLRDTFSRSSANWTGKSLVNDCVRRLLDLDGSQSHGIGVWLEPSPAGPIIAGVIDGTPAARHGQLLPGDVVVAVDPTGGDGFKPTAGRSLTEVMAMIQGRANQPVSLQLRSGSDEEPRVVRLTRQAVKRHILVRVRPGGAEQFTELQAELRDYKIVFGFTVVSADDTLTFGYETE